MKNFFGELRRRKVTRVAAIYMIVAWALIEASSVIFPALRLPEWTVTFVVILALLGFPVSLIFAWVFDFTREGIVRTPRRESLPREQRERLQRGRLVDFAVIAVLLGVVGWLGWERVSEYMPGMEAEAMELDSIAVLPFVNLSGDPENEYFSDGLAEEILNSLVQVDDLRVAARTSSFEYKGRNIDVRRIGEALNVDTVLEGSVRKSGERVRVTAQLIRTDDGFHLWSESYDGNLEDIFALQDELSLAIVDALRKTLGQRERARVKERMTADVDAFEAYLRGRFELHRRTSASLARAVEYFQQAIEHDPDYAAAHSGLSDAWILRSSYGGAGEAEAVERAGPHAQRALELNPGLAEAHASWGLVLRNKDELEASIEPLQRAIELNPSYSPAYHWLGLTYQELFRYEEAVKLLRQAIEVDPEYVTGKRALLTSLRNIGADEEADALARELARDHADEPMVFYGLGGDALWQGRRVEAVRHVARAISLAPRDPMLRMNMAYTLAMVGDLERAAEQMDIAAQLNPGHPALETWEIDLAFQRDVDEAIELAERHIDGLDPGPERDEIACNVLIFTERPREARNACSRLLERAGWEPGEPLSTHSLNASGNLMLAAMKLDDTETVEQVMAAFTELLDRMEAGGMVGNELEWNRALIAAHRDGDTEKLLEALPEQLASTRYNWRMVKRHLPLFEPVRDDPRFKAIIEGHRAQLDRDLEAIREIEIPGI